MNQDIKSYNDVQSPGEIQICSILSEEICQHLSEAGNKIWRFGFLMGIRWLATTN